MCAIFLNDDATSGKLFKRTSVEDMLPQQADGNKSAKRLDVDRFQNVHPLLPWYQFDLNTSRMSYDEFMHLIDIKE